MQAAEFLRTILDPGLAVLAHALPPTDRAAWRSPQLRVLLLAIAGQETEWTHRRQIGSDAARGFWQFQRADGLRMVLNRPSTAYRASAVIRLLSLPHDEATLFEAIAWNDALAVVCARLLLWTDAAAIPSIADEHGAWLYYLRLWRPGKPRPDDWKLRHNLAAAAVG